MELGEMLDFMLTRLNKNARVVLCGMFVLCSYSLDYKTSDNVL